jgi:hypothetical protein
MCTIAFWGFESGEFSEYNAPLIVKIGSVVQILLMKFLFAVLGVSTSLKLVASGRAGSKLIYQIDCPTDFVSVIC